MTDSTPTCIKCRLWPCACRYIAQLNPGGEHHHLAAAASEAVGTGAHHDACPCPRCWSARAATWGSVWVEVSP